MVFHNIFILGIFILGAVRPLVWFRPEVPRVSRCAGQLQAYKVIQLEVSHRRSWRLFPVLLSSHGRGCGKTPFISRSPFGIRLIRRPEEHIVCVKLLSPPPCVLSMVLADQVHRDSASGKFSILGTYSVIQSVRFPCVISALQLYVALTECRGRVPLRLVLGDVDEEVPAAAFLEGEFQSSDPTQVVEVNFQWRNVVFQRPGDYLLQLFSGKESLRAIHLRVALASVPSMQRRDNDDYGDLLRQ